MHEFASTTAASANDLSAAMDVALPIFVLVDPMLGEPLYRVAETGEGMTTNREAGWQRNIIPVKLDPSISLSPHQHPYLVALTGPDDPLLEETMEIAQEERLEAQKNGLDGDGGGAHRIGGWIQSSLHAEQLAERLSSMFRVNTAAFTKARYMRQVDRRVLSLLRHVAGDARVCAQFGRLNSWTYVDVQGGLVSLRSADEEVTPIRLSSAEWAVMENGELLHRAVAQWLGEKVRANEAMPAIATEEISPRFLSAATEAKLAAKKWPLRFAGTADLTAWITLSILRPGISKSGAVARLMEQAGGPDEIPDLLRYLHPDISALADLAPAS